MFQGNNAAVAYVYCDHKDSAAQTASNLLSSLVQQVVEQHKEMPKTVKEFHAEHKNGKVKPLLSSYLVLYQHLAGNFRQIFILVDALDECSENDGDGGSHQLQLLNALHLILAQETRTSNCSLMIMSRKVQPVQSSPCQFTPIKISAASVDITRFISSRFGDKTLFKSNDCLLDNPALRAEIVDTLVQRANGM